MFFLLAWVQSISWDHFSTFCQKLPVITPRDSMAMMKMVTMESFHIVSCIQIIYNPDPEFNYNSAIFFQSTPTWVSHRRGNFFTAQGWGACTLGEKKNFSKYSNFVKILVQSKASATISHIFPIFAKWINSPGIRDIPGCTKGVEGQTMTHGIELWAMSLNIKPSTFEPGLPVKLDFSKIRSKLSGQQPPTPKKRAQHRKPCTGIMFPRVRVMLKYGVQTLGISPKAWRRS